MQVYATAFGQVGTVGSGTITWSGGNVWSGTPIITSAGLLFANYTNLSGAVTHVIQNGTSLTFVDSMGATSPGFWIGPTTVFATAWQESATTATGKLLWQDGSIWSENLVINGNNNGSGTTTITVTAEDES